MALYEILLCKGEYFPQAKNNNIWRMNSFYLGINGISLPVTHSTELVARFTVNALQYPDSHRT